MANFDVNFPTDFMSELLDTPAEKICLEALNEVSPLLEQEMKASAKATILHEGESEMIESIAPSKAKRTKDGSAFIVNVCPKGQSDYTYNGRQKYKRKQKISNALKAIWKEYGIAGKQAPTPFIAHATNNARDKVIQKLQEIYNNKIGKNK